MSSALVVGWILALVCAISVTALVLRGACRLANIVGGRFANQDLIVPSFREGIFINFVASFAVGIVAAAGRDLLAAGGVQFNEYNGVALTEWVMFAVVVAWGISSTQVQSTRLVYLASLLHVLMLAGLIGLPRLFS